MTTALDLTRAVGLIPAVWTEAGLPAAIVFLRVAAAMALLPAFGETTVPVRVRLSLALAFTCVIWPAVSLGDAVGRSGPAGLLALLLSETAAGLALGFSLRVFVLALQAAGTMAAQSASLAQMFGGVGAEPMPALGHLMIAGGLALAVIMGLPGRVAGMLVLSYELWPAGTWPDAGTLRTWGVDVVAHSFSLAFSLAAPFLIAGLISNVAMGVINRAMPQLMVMMIGAPAMALAAVGLAALAVPVGLGLWAGLLANVAADPFGALP